MMTEPVISQCAHLLLSMQLKENNSQSGFVVDREDSSLTVRVFEEKMFKHECYLKASKA